MVALGVYLIALSGCGDLSRDELNRGVESLSALAAQGQLIANGVARDATKSTYTRKWPGSWPISSLNCRPSLATSITERSSKSTWGKSRNRPTRSSLA